MTTVTDPEGAAFHAPDPFSFLAELVETVATPEDLAQRVRRFAASGGEVLVQDKRSIQIQMPDGHHVLLLVGPAPETSTELVECLPPLHIDPVPHAAIATARRIRAARRRLVESGAYDYKALAEGREASVEATRQFVSRAQRRHQIFTVDHDGVVLVPQFLLDETLDPIPEYAEILTPLSKAGSSPWAIWNWMVSPSGWLDGATPVELAHSRHDLVVAAAKSNASSLA